MTLEHRKLKDKIINVWVKSMVVFIILIPVLIAISLVTRSWYVMGHSGLTELLFSSVWRPFAGEFGFWPFIISSLWVSFLGLLFTTPICLLTAIYLTQYKSKRLLSFMQPVIDIMAGIPSVIYGVWGILVLVPIVRFLGGLLGIETSGFSILAGGLVVAVMLIPFILNILIEVFRTVPQDLFEASLSLGASKWHTIKNVLLRKTFPGIISAFGLGLSRAFGETIAVLMVVGNVVQIPNGIFDPGYPLPALIANTYGEMLSIPMFDSALMFAALLLLIVVVVSNILSRLTIIHFEKH